MFANFAPKVSYLVKNVLNMTLTLLYTQKGHNLTFYKSLLPPPLKQKTSVGIREKFIKISTVENLLVIDSPLGSYVPPPLDLPPSM